MSRSQQAPQRIDPSERDATKRRDVLALITAQVVLTANPCDLACCADWVHPIAFGTLQSGRWSSSATQLRRFEACQRTGKCCMQLKSSSSAAAQALVSSAQLGLTPSPASSSIAEYEIRGLFVPLACLCEELCPPS